MVTEVPTKTLQDVMREAKRMGLKGLHGLEEEEEKWEDEGNGEQEDDDIEFGEEMEVDKEGEEGDEEEDDDDEDEEDDDQEEEEEEEDADEVVEDEGESTKVCIVEIMCVFWSHFVLLSFIWMTVVVEREVPPPVNRQTLIFSATLVMPEEMRKSGKGKQFKGKKDKKNKKAGAGEDVVSRIMREVGVRGKPAIVDLSTNKTEYDKSEAKDDADTASTETKPAAAASKGKAGKSSLALPPGLELSYIKSVGGQKDTYLYYFLRRYPGRSIIFTNSIDQTRRIAQLLSVS